MSVPCATANGSGDTASGSSVADMWEDNLEASQQSANITMGTEDNSLETMCPTTVKCDELPYVENTHVVSYIVNWHVHINSTSKIHVRLYPYNQKYPYVSPHFHFGQANEHKAQIVAKLKKGSPTSHGLKLGLMFVSPVNKLPPGIVEFSLPNGSKQTGRFSSESCQLLTFPEMSYDDIKNKAHYCCFTLTCEVKIQETDISTSKDLTLKLVADFGALLDKATYTDATINVEGKTLRVHKAILAARSPVFAAMFETDMAEKNISIDIEDLSFKTIYKMVSFIYQGTVPLLVHDIVLQEELMAAADKYGLDDLKSECGEQLARNVNTENAIRLMILGERYCHGGLRESAANYAKVCRLSVKDTEDYKRIKESDPRLLLEAMIEK